MAEQNSKIAFELGIGGGPSSPPKSEVDETPIHNQLNKNKESLKVKLMLRRPIDQLVNQGILPSPKTPPAFFVQKQKLERAKMGDFLKAKIQKRPGRQELIQQHILEDTGNVDPSLAERQRQLKKARLADSLNDQLSHRPGPLELIKGNILHTDHELEKAVKEGQIQFKKTSEGEMRKNPPRSFASPEPSEDDSGSDGTMSPLQDWNLMSPSPSATTVSQICSFTTSLSPSLGSTSSLSSLSSLSSVSSPPGMASITKVPSMLSLSQPLPPVSVSISSQFPCSLISQLPPHSAPKSDAPGKDSTKNRKKSKPKAQAKARTIKFHEYKGPPNAQKNQSSHVSSVETSYELLLKQQQLLLQMQMQLGWQHKYPQIILPANKSSDQVNGSNLNLAPKLSVKGNVPHSALPQANINAHTDGFRSLAKLEDMKVSDLKAELKKRNLPVSGSKPQLIERLRPYSDVTTSAATGSVQLLSTALSSTGSTSLTTVNVGPIMLESSPSPVSLEEGSDRDPAPDASMDTLVASNSQPNSVAPMEVESEGDNTMDTSDFTNGERKFSSSLADRNEPPPPPPMPPSKLCLPSCILNSKLDDAVSGLPPLIPCTSFEQDMCPVTTPEASPSIITRQEHEIEEIVKDLQLSQQHMHLLKGHEKGHNHSSYDPKLQKLLLQQHLQNKLQQNKLQMQLLELHNLQKQKQPTVSQPTNFILTTGTKGELSALVQACSAENSTYHCNPMYTRCNLSNDHRAPSLLLNQVNLVKQGDNGITSSRGSLPSFTVLTQQVGGQPQVKVVGCSDTMPASCNGLGIKPPPNYDEATRQLKGRRVLDDRSSQSNSAYDALGSKKVSIKSQAVDDVLEILIRNGELPPSAAQEPPTPTTPKQDPSSIVFPQVTATVVLSNSKLIFKPSTVPTPPPLPMWTLCDNVMSSRETCPDVSNSLSSSHINNNNNASMCFNSTQTRTSDGCSEQHVLNRNTGPVTKTETQDLSDLSLDLTSLGNSTDLNQLDGGLKLDSDSVINSGLNNNNVNPLHEWGSMMDIDNDLFSSLSSSLNIDNNYEASEMSKDPLLTCSQEPLDFFNLEDLDMKMCHSSWDKLDFPT